MDSMTMYYGQNDNIINLKEYFMKNTKTNVLKWRSILATQIRRLLSPICAIVFMAIIGFTMTTCGSGDDGITIVSVTGVSLNQNSLALTVGGSAALTATVAPINATNKAVTWSSSDAAKAAVENGVVTAVAAGTATITVTTADGGKTAVCSVTVTSGNGEHVHQWGEWVVTKAPTETEEGEETRTCALDGTTETRPIAPLNHVHDWDEWAVTTPATCTTAGEETRVCTLNPAYTETRPIAALGHDFGAWTQTTAPTCTTAGVETRTCAHDATHTETRIGAAALGHDYQWQVTTPATYTSAGIETEICSHDPTHTRNTRPIPQTPFTSAASLGTWLSSQFTNTAATAYTVKLNVNDLTTPTNIRTTLNNAAGKYVILDLSGSTFTTVPDRLFYGDDFQGCATLTGIILPNGVTSIENYAFYSCTSLASIDIPNSVTSIGEQAFVDCTSLASIDIPNSVTSIGEQAFVDCSSLTSITIPDSVTSIGDYAFVDCSSLTAINVDAANTAYSSVDGVLYNNDKTTLFTYPIGKTGSTFAIPDSVTSIGDDAFGNCTSLASVTIPNSVTSIGWCAFSGCTSLTSVTIPSSVIRIREGAFYGCSSLTSVTFATGSNISSYNFGNDAFPQGSTGKGGNNLRTAYNNTGKAGTYTRASGGSTWAKQL